MKFNFQNFNHFYESPLNSAQQHLQQENYFPRIALGILVQFITNIFEGYLKIKIPSTLKHMAAKTC